MVALAIPSIFIAAKPSAIAAAPTFISTSEKPSGEADILLAQSSRTRRIRFEPGADSTVIEDAVVRGTRDIYLLGAKRGQRMTVSITSVENNAVFNLQAPTKRTLSQEATNYSGVLPATGDYRISVGGTRGNASYTLEVTIK